MAYVEAYFMYLTPRVVHNLPKIVGEQILKDQEFWFVFSAVYN